MNTEVRSHVLAVLESHPLKKHKTGEAGPDFPDQAGSASKHETRMSLQ
jgi:hypothetical protein